MRFKGRLAFGVYLYFIPSNGSVPHFQRFHSFEIGQICVKYPR